MKNLFINLKRSNHSSFYLSFFRVIICLLLIKQVFQIFPLLSLAYTENNLLAGGSTSIIEFINLDSQILRDHIHGYMYVYLFCIILYLFGIGKNFTAFIVFLMTDILQKLNPYLLNGGDNILKFLLLYMVFANSFTYFSLSKTKGNNRYSNMLSNLSVLSICLHVCLIYFLSALHKTNATVWFHGVATYYTFQLERFSGTDFNSVLAKNNLFVVISTYFTLLLELYYPALVWFKKTRTVVILGMISIHVGIAIFMMLYDFQFIFILVQGFFYRDNFWLPKYAAVKSKIETYKFFLPFKKS